MLKWPLFYKFYNCSWWGPFLSSHPSSQNHAAFTVPLWCLRKTYNPNAVRFNNTAKGLRQRILIFKTNYILFWEVYSVFTMCFFFLSRERAQNASSRESEDCSALSSHHPFSVCYLHLLDHVTFRCWNLMTRQWWFYLPSQIVPRVRSAFHTNVLCSLDHLKVDLTKNIGRKLTKDKRRA